MAILELLGVPLEDRAQFFKWTNTMAFADDPDVAGGMEDAQTASFEVMIYAAELAQKQRQGFTGSGDTGASRRGDRRPAHHR
jgi:cytochrome P450